MRKKAKVYLGILILFAVASSGTLLWNSTSLLESLRLADIEKARHESFHHLLMSVRTSLLELYRYEAGYSPDLDALVSSVEEAEEGLAAILDDGLTPGFRSVVEDAGRKFEDFKLRVSDVVTSGKGAEKISRSHDAAVLGREIALLLAEAERISKTEIARMEAAFARKISVSRLILSVTLIITLLAAAIFYLHARMTVLSPFAKLIGFVEEMSKTGDLGARMNVPADEDLALLARRFNEMMERMERSEEELKCNYEELRVANEEIQSSYVNLEELTTEMEEKSQALNDANEELKSLDRLKNEFMQNVSHELRTPLTPVSGYLELFLNKDLGGLAPMQIEIMNDMYHCCKRLSFIIDSLLEMVSLQEEYPTEKFERVDLPGIVKELSEQCGIDAQEKGLSFKVECPDRLPVVSGARKKLLLMLNHILKNAVKFTPEGGEVTFSVRSAKGDKIEFLVRDTGIGIAEDKISKIFEPFLQLDSSLTRGYEGVGLGLALVKRIVEIHKGSIGVKSLEGEGTEVVVSIPVA